MWAARQVFPVWVHCRPSVLWCTCVIHSVTPLSAALEVRCFVIHQPSERSSGSSAMQRLIPQTQCAPRLVLSALITHHLTVVHLIMHLWALRKWLHVLWAARQAIWVWLIWVLNLVLNTALYKHFMTDSMSYGLPGRQSECGAFL